MSTGLAIPVFCASLALTLVATVVFARELDRLSERLGVSEGLHGILTALGADAPEIATAVAALVSSRSKIGVGVVVGSNVFNLAALLGLSALVAGHVRIHRHGLLLNGGVALAVTALAAALVLGAIGAVAATILLVAVLAPYMFFLSIRPARIARIVPPGRCGILVAAVREEVGPAHRRGRPEGLPPGSAGARRGAGRDRARERGDGARGDRSRPPLGRVRRDRRDAGARRADEPAEPHDGGEAGAARPRRGGRQRVAELEQPQRPGGDRAAGARAHARLRFGLVTFSVWWLVGMTAVAVVLIYAREGLRRTEGALIVALYVAFAAVIASR